MFLGKHYQKIGHDNVCRIPAKFKRHMKGDLYLIQGFEKNLLCLTERSFHEIFLAISSNNIADPLARLLLRLILSTAHITRMTKDGHLTIPETLIGFIGREDGLCLVGQGDYFEIWSVGAWKQQEEILLDSELNASRFSSLEITLR